MRQCYDSSTVLGSENRFCDDITRDSDGNINRILQRDFNLAEIRSRGYDVAMEYQFEMGKYGFLKFKADYNHVIEHTETFVGNDGEETNNFNGELASGTFEDRTSASLTWTKNDWRVRWRTRFLGSVVDSNARVDDYKELFAENQALIEAGDPDAVLNPEVPRFLFYGSYIRHNLSVSKVLDIANAEVNIFGGVNNMFDKNGPFVPNTGDNVESGRGNFHSSYGGGIGRSIYLGTKIKFLQNPHLLIALSSIR